MKISALLLLFALTPLATLPAGAQAAGSRCPASASLLCGGALHLGAVEGEGVVEGEEAEAGAEEGEESEEAGAEEADAATAEEEGEEEDASAHAGHKAKGRSPVRLTRLALTHGSLAALHHVHPTAASVSFSFTSSSAAALSVTLTAQSAGAHPHWHPVARFTLAAKRGANIAHVHGHGDLSAGPEKLTLSPAHGRPTAVAFRVG